MRLKINFTPNTIDVPIQNQAMLNSYVHKCLGINNEYHDSQNNYAISHLYGGKLNKQTNTLKFDNGGYIVASSMDGDFLNKLLVGILNNPELFCGMKFKSVEHIEEEFHDGWNHFATLSPFLIKKDGKFIKLTDDNFETKVKSYLMKKINKIDSSLSLDDFDIKIPNNATHKVKHIMVKNVINYANQCHISVHTNKKVAKLLYNIGIGKSTASGFGTIYKTENRRIYH